MKDFIIDGRDDASTTILFAHGAGAPMDSDVMTVYAKYLARRGFRVVRFEFGYMQKRRLDGKKRPPDRQPALLELFGQVRDRLRACSSRLILGGKSMGGRMATILAAQDPAGQDGVLVFGYPFHPPGKPDRLRIDHLPAIEVPVLICQGERDPFGKRDEVAGYPLPDTLHLHWAPDGDHDLKPRKSAGHTAEDNWHAAAKAAARIFLDKAGKQQT